MTVYSLGWYFPVGTERSSFDKDQLSQLILNGIKNKRGQPYFNSEISKNAFALFKAVLSKIFLENNNYDRNKLVFLVVPSSTANNPEHGISKLINEFTVQSGIGNYLSYLIRTNSLTKAAGGVHHDKDTHKRTITLQNHAFFDDKTVILIDDVITTGSAMQACFELLQAANPREIICLTLGKTFSKGQQQSLYTPANIENISEFKNIKEANNANYSAACRNALSCRPR